MSKTKHKNQLDLFGNEEEPLAAKHMGSILKVIMWIYTAIIRPTLVLAEWTRKQFYYTVLKG